MKKNKYGIYEILPCEIYRFDCYKNRVSLQDDCGIFEPILFKKDKLVPGKYYELSTGLPIYDMDILNYIYHILVPKVHCSSLQMNRINKSNMHKKLADYVKMSCKNKYKDALLKFYEDGKTALDILSYKAKDNISEKDKEKEEVKRLLYGFKKSRHKVDINKR